MNEIVTTVNGISCKKDKCRLIDKKYYLIGNVNIENSGDVYYIDGRYIRFETKRIAFNKTICKYQLKNYLLNYGIVSMDINCNFLNGYFSNDNENVFLIDENKNTHCCINENIINKNFREEACSGIFYHISLKKAREFNIIKDVKKTYKEHLPYDSGKVMYKYIEKYNKYTPVINDTIKNFSKAIGDLTFGLEFETIKGVIPDNRLDKLPLIPLRDGSISGLEYVTVPLSGDKGVKAVVDCVKELKKRTIYNNDCALHLHIGNVPRTPEFILAFYKLISFHQEEIFSYFPLYKKYNFGVKRKNYSKPFPINEINFKLDPSIDYSCKVSVNKNFDVLFAHLSGGYNFYGYDCDLRNVYNHPLDPNGNQKWNIKNRYYAHNLIPLIFGNKQTIEFRIHTPTYNIDKILNFLFINSYLINYAIKNQNSILCNPNFLVSNNQNGLSRIIINSIDSLKMSSNHKEILISYHLNYLQERKIITDNDNCVGNIVGSEELIECHKSIDWNSGY